MIGRGHSDLARLGQDFFHHMSMDICQSSFEAVVVKRQTFVVIARLPYSSS
jgi:hypothetical protein